MQTTSSEKRVLMFIPRMGNGGAERVMATLANQLVSDGYQVLILTLITDESFYHLNDSVEIMGMDFQIDKNNKIKRMLNMVTNGGRALIKYHDVVKEWKPDIIISFLTHTNLLSILMKPFNHRTKLIVSERAEPNERNLLTRLATKFLYPFADQIVCQSQKVTEFFPNYAKGKLTVIANPISLDSIAEEVTPFEKRREVIVGVGRLFEQKNFELLINAFSDIAPSFPKYKLEIYGDGPLRESLQQQIRNLNLTESVLLKGVKKNVMQYVSDCSLFVMSSNFEGFPNALVEAMASGLPVVSTNFSTGVAKDLIKTENGLVVPIKDRHRLADAMQKILADDKQRERMCLENRKLKDVLSVQKICEQWLAIMN